MTDSKEPQTTSGKRILVCGGRAFKDDKLLWSVLNRVRRKYDSFVLVHGDCRGADRLARDWAVQHGIPHDPHPADWDMHGKAAGPIRNREMLNSGLHGVIAFPGGNGTAHMISIAKEKGVPVWVIQ